MAKIIVIIIVIFLKPRLIHALSRSAEMRPVATNVAHSVVCVNVCVRHTDERYKIGRTDQLAVWELTHVGKRNHVFHGSAETHGKGRF